MTGQNDLTHECDLIEYDGPLLSLYRDSHGNPVVFHWCDQSLSHNTWLVLYPSHEMIEHFTTGSIGFIFLYESCDSTAELVDIDGDMQWSNKRPFVFDEHPEYIGTEDFYL